MKKRKDPTAPNSASPGEDGAALPSRSKQERAFNRWLNDQLRKKYDPVLDETIPDELLALLRQDRDRK